MRERLALERELALLGVREFDANVSAPAADTVDADAAQPLFAAAVKDRVEPLPAAAAVKTAATWNSARHPSQSGISTATLAARLEQYVNRSAVVQAMTASATLKVLAANDAHVLAVMAHQFQQKVYAVPRRGESNMRDGQIGEGTLDALGFVRHTGDNLNRVDVSNERFHTGKDGAGESDTYKRLKAVYRTNQADFEAAVSGLSASNWFRFYVNPPFLGRSFRGGIHLELLRRLRAAERRLIAMTAYAGKSAVELGAALLIDEDHHGGRAADKTSTSMHTFGLAVDIGYVKNPWVAGQHDSPRRNRNFREVSRNVSRMLHGTAEELTSSWLSRMGADSNTSSIAAYDAVRAKHDDLLAYLALGTDRAGLQAAIAARPDVLQNRGESVEAAVRRWTQVIRADRAKLQIAFGSNRRPEDGFLNLQRDLVVALRDTGCLAWGAIDIGASESGDMMHFDCRASGIGRIVQPTTSHTIVSGHPCVSSLSSPSRVSAVRREFEVPSGNPARQKWGKPNCAKVWTYTGKSLAVTTALYLPCAAAAAKDLELLLFAHGLNTCPPLQRSMPQSFITDCPYMLGAVVEDSGRTMALAVPFFDWPNLTANKMNLSLKGPGAKWHRLGDPKTLNALIDELLSEIGRATGKGKPNLRRLVIAAHSGGYGLLDPLANAHADPEMLKGALSKLTHLWGFDTTYTWPGKAWEDWTRDPASPAMTIFYGGHKKGTTKGGEQFASIVRRLPRHKAIPAPTDHCSLPTSQLPALLSSLP